MYQAIKSCLASKLTTQTQFVVVNNASTAVDEYKHIIGVLRNNIAYDFIYEKLPENKGVGGGRNVCFDLAKGEYVYFLDDDAEIAPECYQTFFVEALQYLDKNQNVMTLTTKIEDNVFGRRNPAVAKTLQVDKLSCVYAFQGGSTFFRRKYFMSPLFMDIMYGHEEIPVAMSVLDAGYSNVYMPDIFINHLPMVDKWKLDHDKISVHGINNLYAIKILLYPKVFRILLFAAYKLRMKNCKIRNKTVIKEEKKSRKNFILCNKIKKVRFITVMKAFREFGLVVF